jgi:hypothetical protein
LREFLSKAKYRQITLRDQKKIKGASVVISIEFIEKPTNKFGRVEDINATRSPNRCLTKRKVLIDRIKARIIGTDLTASSVFPSSEVLNRFI